MPTSILSKSELITIVLADIRKCEGCDGVDSIAIQEMRHLRSAANWEISIIAASSGEPAVVQRAAIAVQRDLQARYRLRGELTHQFQAGDRVRLSAIGRHHVPAKQTVLGTVGIDNLRTSGDRVRVLFDGSNRSIRLHHSYIDPASPEDSAESAG